MKRDVLVIDDYLDERFFHSINGGQIHIVKNPAHCASNPVNHGAVVSAILHELAPDVRLHFYAMANASGKINGQHLRDALQYALDNQIKYVNLSAGSVYYHDLSGIFDTLWALAEHGHVVVAAASNAGKITYPACLEQVIGVKAVDGRPPNRMFLLSDPLDGIDVGVSRFDTAVVAHLAEAYGFPRALPNSLAAPYVTARIVEKNIRSYRDKKRICGETIQCPPACREEITVPVIGFFSHTDVQLGAIQREFHDAGYTCAVLVQDRPSDPASFLFHLDQGRNVRQLKYYATVLQTDLILVQLRSGGDAPVHFCDLTVSEAKPAGQIYRQILAFFNDS